MKAERSRKSAIRRIRRENFEIVRNRRGSYTVRLKVNHQAFQLHESGFYTSYHHAWWTITQAAIALHRFKYGY